MLHKIFGSLLITFQILFRGCLNHIKIEINMEIKNRNNNKSEG